MNININRNDSIFVTHPLKTLINSSREQKRTTLDQLEFIVQELGKEKGKDRALKALGIYEGMFKTYLPMISKSLPRDPICKKSCNACCYQFVATSPYEAELIYEVMESKKLQISKKSLRYQARFKEPTSYWAKFGKRMKCVFLNNEGGCDIYEWRPVTCRSLYAVDDCADVCSPSEGQRVKSVKYMNNVPGELVISALMTLAANEGQVRTSPTSENFIHSSLPASLLALMEKRR